MAAANFEIVVPLTDAVAALHLICRLAAERKGKRPDLQRQLRDIDEVARDTLRRCTARLEEGRSE